MRHALCFKVWLGWEDSNLRIQVPKTCVLPLDDTPIFFEAMSNLKAQLSNFQATVKAEIEVKVKNIKF